MMTSSLTEALGWTLLHSLWQATLVAGAFYLVRQIIRHRPPQVYTAALGALLVIIGWSLYTLVDLYEPERVAGSPVTRFAPTTLPPATSPVVIASAPTDKAFDPSWIEIVVAWINSYISFITMGWLLGMVILSARLAGGRWYLERLRHHHTYPLPAWEAAAATLATRLRLRRPVTVMASGLAKVPLVIGHLKPLILLPTALVSNLPPEQIEAILAHELAHVRRHDYWVNMLQSLIEVIFFYHPMVWWLSSVVREEREKCCDDLAVSLCGNTLVYAKALSEAESLKHPAAPLVVAFAKRGGLLARIERLVSPRTSSTSMVTKVVTLVPMLLLVIYLAGEDTLARKAINSEPQPKTTAPAAFLHPLPILADTAHSVEKAEVKGNEPEADKAPTPNASLPTDTIPNENKDRSHFSFQFGDSSDFSFDMRFPFDDDDSTHRNGFRHWRFSSSDTFPDFAWDDSLWRESIGELSEKMEGFSEELATYLDDSVDTEALQQRLGSVQQELSRLQAELGTSLQRTFSDEKMEALQRRLQREQEQLGRDLQEKSRRLQEQQRQFQEEAQRRLQENTSEEKIEALQKELQEAQKRLQRELQDEQSWRNEESNRKLEELKRLTEEMEQNPWFDDESGNDSLRLEEVQRALEEMQQQNKNEQRHFSESAEDSLKFKESQREFREKQRRFQEENQRRLRLYRAETREQAQAHVQMHNDFDDTVNRLEETLLADGLIKSGKEYRFELKAKGLYINRKKQDQELLVKYRDLLNVSDSTSFSITRTAR